MTTHPENPPANHPGRILPHAASRWELARCGGDGSGIDQAEPVPTDTKPALGRLHRGDRVRLHACAMMVQRIEYELTALGCMPSAGGVLCLGDRARRDDRVDVAPLPRQHHVAGRRLLGRIGGR